MNEWLLLAIAILFEVTGTLSLKASNGLTKLIPTLLMALFYAISFTALAIALKKIEVGVAYAIWGGVGIGLIALFGVVFFGETASFVKFASVALIILGIIGLNLSGGVH